MAIIDFLIISAPYSSSERGQLERLRPSVSVERPAGIWELPKEIRDQIRVVAFRGGQPLTNDMLSALPNLSLIANYGVGHDAIDTVTARAQGIKITNTPDVLNDCVADLAVGMAIALSRNIVNADHFVREHEWQRGAMFPRATKFTKKKAGILGLGRIGREIANRLAAFKMDIHYYSRTPKDTPNWTYFTSLTELANSVDFLFITTIGGSETKGIISSEIINALGPKGIIINVSRGSTIDENALIKALEEGTIGGAALDVFNNEPSIDARFYKLKNVILLPHLGSSTQETRQEMLDLQIRNIEAYFAGSPLASPI